jgi:glycosyltransferase involved in cell wall biosynthesis
VIPNILHFVWVGDPSRRPDQLLRTWVEHNPTWTIKVWGDDDLISAQWRTQQQIRELAEHDARAAAALLRWEILLAEGGLVFDIDSFCMRPLDDFLLDCETFACWENELTKPGAICADFVGSVPNNPFIEKLLVRIGADPDLRRKPVEEAAGSGLLTRVWQSERYAGLMLYPSQYFNPRDSGAGRDKAKGRVYSIRGVDTARVATANGGTMDAESKSLHGSQPHHEPAAISPLKPRSGADAVRIATAPWPPVQNPEDPSGVLNLNFFGQVGKTGIGRHCESVLLSLLKAHPPGLRMNFLDCMSELSVRQLLVNGRAGKDVTLFFWRMDSEFVRQVPGRKVIWVVFESDRLPPLWLDQMQAYDRVWTPSDWGRDVLLAHGLEPDRVRVVEEGVNDVVFRPEPIAHPGFVFLSVGKYEDRKSIDETIEAFKAEFPASYESSVQLWLKADYPGRPARAAQLRSKVASDPRIRILSDSMTDRELAKVYNSADAFVFPSKAEGFGLPCIEAIACGVPLIATDYSGQSVILKHIRGLFVPVDYSLVPIDDADYCNLYRGDYDSPDLGRWADPSMPSLRQAMRAVYQDNASWRERAARASEIIHSRLSWDRIGAKVLHELADVQRPQISIVPPIEAVQPRSLRRKAANALGHR